MEPRRDGDDDGVYAAIRKRLVIAAEGLSPVEPAAELFRLARIPAGVARDDRARERPFQVLAMDPGDESASKEGDMQRLSALLLGRAAELKTRVVEVEPRGHVRSFWPQRQHHRHRTRVGRQRTR